jgi:hypothetical protein
LLTIRPTQAHAFEDAAEARYNEELIAHLVNFAPRLAVVLRREGLQRVVAMGREQAAVHEFSMRGNVRCFVELMLSLGSSFDRDHQLPWAAGILGDRSITCQMARAERLYDAALIFLDEVQGPDNQYSLAALRRLVEISDGGEDQLRWLSSLDSFEALTLLYPEKCSYIGEAAARETIRLGQSMAHQYACNTALGAALCTGLIFGFGSGVFSDPVYPWILGAVTHPQLKTAEQRTERLLRRVRTYSSAMLSHLTAGNGADA